MDECGHPQVTSSNGNLVKVTWKYSTAMGYGSRSLTHTGSTKQGFTRSSRSTVHHVGLFASNLELVERSCSVRLAKLGTGTIFGTM